MLFRGTALAIACGVLVAGGLAQVARADDTSEANALFVEAVLAWDEAATESDGAERLRLLETVDRNLQEIITAHPGSDLAVRLVIGDAFGPLSVPGVRAALDEAVAVAAVAQVWTDCIAAPNPRCIMAEVERQSQSVPEAQTSGTIISNATLVEVASGQFDSALAMTAPLDGYFLDAALSNVAIAQANASKVTDAHATADRIKSLNRRIRALVTIANAEFAMLLWDQSRATLIGAYKETGSATDPGEMNRLRETVIEAMAELGLAQDALTFALDAETVEDRDELLLRIVRAQATEGLIDPAIETAALIEGADALERAQSAIAVAEAKAGMTAEALERADGITDSVDRSLTLSDIAVSLAEDGETSLAEATLAKAIAIAAEQGDDSWIRFNIFRSAGTAQAAMGQTDTAGQSFEAATAAAIEFGAGGAFRSMAMALVAEDLFKAGLPDQARRVLEQARDLAQAIPEDDDQKVSALTEVARAARQMGQDDLASGVLQLAIQAALERVDPVDRIEGLSDIAGDMSRPDI
jgi:tetratricopeptide (TPR) repeat protein